jgi:hypothetical protein
MRVSAPWLCAAVLCLLSAGPAGAGASCSAIGQEIAAHQGGMLVRATPAQGGRACTIVIVVPARNGERSRRIEMTVPAE